MNEAALHDTASALVAGDKGLLAMDESNGTCNKRFAALGIAQSIENRRAWRDLIITAPGLADQINGVILFDETIRQATADGTPFLTRLKALGIIAGIKVDLGANDLAGFPGEKITEGLDGLRDRLDAYAAMGARFAKWRAVVSIGSGLPSLGCMEANAHSLARYAALSQQAGLVPIVEPEVLMDGDHTLEQCRFVSEQMLSAVFGHLARQRVLLEGIILKPAMVLPGLSCAVQDAADVVADATITTLLRVVPAAVPGVAFLSGGQTARLATARLNAINQRFARARTPPPWALSFSFARAIQQPALEIWRGEAKNASSAQQALVARAQLNRLARTGTYTAALERD